MRIVNSEFIVSAVSTNQYPKEELPEIVLVGKSNVGKSSFINTLTNRKKLARTSSVPGKTRLINFYKISSIIRNDNIEDQQDKNSNEIERKQNNLEIKNQNIKKAVNEENYKKDFYFVDLPGYGFSKMSKEEQIKVGKFIEEYLKKSKNIALIVFLIDIRHNPTEDDKLMYNYIISQNLPCIVICSKADKIAVTKVDDEVCKLQESLNPLKDITFLPFSTERKIYTEEVLKEISKNINK